VPRPIEEELIDVAVVDRIAAVLRAGGITKKAACKAENVDFSKIDSLLYFRHPDLKQDAISCKKAEAIAAAIQTLWEARYASFTSGDIRDLLKISHPEMEIERGSIVYFMCGRFLPGGGGRRSPPRVELSPKYRFTQVGNKNEFRFQFDMPRPEPGTLIKPDSGLGDHYPIPGGKQETLVFQDEVSPIDEIRDGVQAIALMTALYCGQLEAHQVRPAKERVKPYIDRLLA
jgi:hypothetical protein